MTETPNNPTEVEEPAFFTSLTLPKEVSFIGYVADYDFISENNSAFKDGEWAKHRPRVCALRTSFPNKLRAAGAKAMLDSSFLVSEEAFPKVKALFQQVAADFAEMGLPFGYNIAPIITSYAGALGWERKALDYIYTRATRVQEKLVDAIQSGEISKVLLDTYKRDVPGLVTALKEEVPVDKYPELLTVSHGVNETQALLDSITTTLTETIPALVKAGEMSVKDKKPKKGASGKGKLVVTAPA